MAAGLIKTANYAGLVYSAQDVAGTKSRVHSAFANAGLQAGVEIWRIQGFAPIQIATDDFGEFYKGDSYIILKTTADKNYNLSWEIHYWIGSESSQDESGAAAILTVGLNDKFYGAAINYREVLGQESEQFKSYFPSALQYMDGGHASGFNHVVTNAVVEKKECPKETDTAIPCWKFNHVVTNAGSEKTFIQIVITGKKNVLTRQVAPLISSMNKDDCFILDVGNYVYVYIGQKTRNVERLKVISTANHIRDQEHNGRATVEIIDQYSSDVEVQKFFTALESDTRDIEPDMSAGGDDQVHATRVPEDLKPTALKENI